MDLLNKDEWLCRIISNLQEGLIPEAANTHQFRSEKYTNGEYVFIPYDDHSLYKQLLIINFLTYNIKHKLNFVDAGCGIGNIILKAKIILSNRFEYTGIEISKEYISIAQKLNPGAMILNMDAKEIDYSIFDVIYFFCPQVNPEKEIILENRIRDTAKSGAYIIANNSYNFWQHTGNYSIIASNVYQKK